MCVRFLGLDVGPSSGLVWGSTDEKTGKPQVDGIVQCHAMTVEFIIRSLVKQYPKDEWLVQGEKFLTGRSAGSKGKDADVSRFVLNMAKAYFEALPNAKWHERPAAMMKPWLSTNRLKAVQFPLGAKFKDARDALGHMMFTACRDGGCKDPLY